MNRLKDTVSNCFKQVFNTAPSHLIQAPGRVNLIGEHTDYNEGFVLPCAIDYQTLVAATPRQDNTVHVVAVDFDHAEAQFDISDAIPPSTQQWANYIQGVVQILAQRHSNLGGANLVVSGNVPQGAGLSSSAALEVAIAETFNQLYALNIDKTELALIAQQAENDYVGVRCGIMDQLISAKGEADHALLIDCRDLRTTAVALPKDISVMIVNSNKQRGLVDGHYNSRREQCEAAARQIGVKALRDADLNQLNAAISDKNSSIYRRAHHVISENARTLAMAKALNDNDLPHVGRLMAQSHASMRDDFAITVAEIDYLVQILQHAIGDNGGARMTGGGFGGCVVALLPSDKVDSVRHAVTSQYQAQTGIKESIYLCTAQAGAGVIV